jgi:hypothetical protein
VAAVSAAGAIPMPAEPPSDNAMVSEQSKANATHTQMHQVPTTTDSFTGGGGWTRSRARARARANARGRGDDRRQAGGELWDTGLGHVVRIHNLNSSQQASEVDGGGALVTGTTSTQVEAPRVSCGWFCWFCWLPATRQGNYPPTDAAGCDAGTTAEAG